MKKSQVIPFLTGILIVASFLLNDTGLSLTYFPGDLGDARFNNYILEHGYRFITGSTDSFWDAPFMYPEKEVISYSDNLLGGVPLYAVFRTLGADRELAFQLWYILMGILSFSACYLLLNWLFRNPYASVLGALIFSISIALECQMTHAQVFPRFPIPLAIWMSLMFCARLDPRYFFLALMLLVYQFYCGMYLGFMLLVPLGITLLIVCIAKWSVLKNRLTDIRWIIAMLSSLAISSALIYPLVQKYTARSEQLIAHEYAYVLDTVPTIHSFMRSKAGSLFWQSLTSGSLPYRDPWDHELFPGGVAILSFVASLFIIILRPWLKKRFDIHLDMRFLILFLAGVITFLLFFRAGSSSLYQLVFHLPGFHSIRAVTRVINVQLLFFALATAFVTHLIFERNRRCVIPIFMLLCVLIIADNHVPGEHGYRTDKTLSVTRINLVAEQIREQPAGTIISYEPDTFVDHIAIQLDAMLASQLHGFRCINGYSSTSPVPYQQYWYKPDSISRMTWLNSFPDLKESVYVAR